MPIDGSVGRVKHYCATCYPNVDQLTPSQLKRMKKCRHSGECSVGEARVTVLCIVAAVNEEVQASETVTSNPASSQKDKSKGTILYVQFLFASGCSLHTYIFRRLLEGEVRRPLLFSQPELTDTISLTQSEPYVSVKCRY